MEFNLHGFKSFDELMAFHCAPALLGVKPANLVCCPTASMPMLAPWIEKAKVNFARQGIAFEILCQCEVRTLLLVYRPAQLEHLLKDSRNSRYLSGLGYEAGEVRYMLHQLGWKINCSKEFPHEIGVFLGYPLEDIVGFVENKGQNCRYSGYWKVYGDVGYAKQLFNIYNNCRDRLMQAIAQGVPLHVAVAS